MPKKCPAFTLIELLIVVAIIGVLAAIAVPNFLNALTRSRVAAARAEFQSIANSIQTYRLDQNRLPPMTDFGVGFRHYRLPSFLTTPVAYMSLLPVDDFQVDEDPFGIIDHTPLFQRYRFHDIGQLVRDRDNVDIPATDVDVEVFGEWRIISVGPDQEYQGYTRYHSSNGIISRGDIYLSEKGMEFVLPKDTRIGSGAFR